MKIKMRPFTETEYSVFQNAKNFDNGAAPTYATTGIGAVGIFISNIPGAVEILLETEDETAAVGFNTPTKVPANPAYINALVTTLIDSAGAAPNVTTLVGTAVAYGAVKIY